MDFWELSLVGAGLVSALMHRATTRVAPTKFNLVKELFDMNGYNRVTILPAILLER
jgi:hypothetical protein